MPESEVAFVKMHGAGNDFVVIDRRGQKPITPDAERVQKICDRRFGIGADGLVFVESMPGADARMVIFNADGSRADMCGNALRCVARWLAPAAPPSPLSLRIATDQGVLEAEVTHSGVRVRMGRPRLERSEIPMLGRPGPVLNEDFEAAGRRWKLTALFLGNPHAVIFVEDVDALDLPALGPALESHPDFPRRVNTNFVQVLSKSEVRQRTFERGVGETLACGTGAASVCVAGVLTGRTGRRITSHLRGGDLELEWLDDDAEVTMTGPAVVVFSGKFGAL